MVPLDGRRPLIGVTGPDRRGTAAWWCTRFALRRAGAEAVRVTPGQPVSLDELDGLVVGGGADIDPIHYLVDVPATPLRRYDPGRDALELELLRGARRRDLPVLGICRGCQLLNVVRGGNLLQDLRPLRRRTSNRAMPLPLKTVTVERDSALERLTGRERLRVNSIHWQAVDRAGEGLRVVARDADGFAQAVEDGGARFALGVQWHPEYLPYLPEQLGLFRALVEAASTRG